MPGLLFNPEEQERFLQRLVGSAPAVFAVALYQYRQGRVVELHPPKVSESAADNINNVDGGDLFIIRDDGRRLRTEVKGLNKPRYHFTSADDFPEEHLFFSNVPAVRRAKGSVYAYVVVNPKRTHAFVVYGSTAKHWYTRDCLPDNTGRVETNYCCPKEHVEFIQL